MTDEQAPPPKKVGSLRDRIAAFEKQSSTQPSAPPVPRAKPGGIAWKPKQPSPPSSPSHHDVERASVPGSRAGGMSAADAKESIGQGGSLKERMAALQGRGAFGAPAPLTAPPKPATEKPKWKPPQPSSSPPSSLIEKDQQDVDGGPAEVSQLSEIVESVDGAETKPEDPEEDEERQRRAAITARLQRLGGSRIGMGPPILGAKPAIKKPTLPKEEEPKVVSESSDIPTQSSPNAQGEDEIRSQSEAVELNQETTSEHLSSAAISSDTPAGGKSPLMPAPAVPRRVAPPRRKAGKPNLPATGTSPPTINSDEPLADVSQAVSTSEVDAGFDGLHSSADTRIGEPTAKLDTPIVEPEVGSDADLATHPSIPTHTEVEIHESSLPGEMPAIPAKETSELKDSILEPLTELVEPNQSSHSGYDAELPPTDDMDGLAAEAKNVGDLAGTEQPEKLKKEINVGDLEGIEQPEELEEDKVQRMESPSAERPAAEAEPVDDDSADRRIRIAERLAKSGGVNPFAAGGDFSSTLGRRSSTSTTASRRDSSDGPLSRSASMRSSPPSTVTSADVSSVTTRVVETEEGSEDTTGHTHRLTEQDTTSYWEPSHEEQYEDDENRREQYEESTPITPKLLQGGRTAVGVPAAQFVKEDISGNLYTQFSEYQELSDPVHADGSEESLSLSTPPVISNALPLPPRPPHANINRIMDGIEDGAGMSSTSTERRPLPPPPPPPPPFTMEIPDKPTTVLTSQGNVLFVPPPPPPPLPAEPAVDKEPHDISSDSSYAEEDEDSFEFPVHHSTDISHRASHPSQPEPEILDDSDCDPIDPGFLAPIIVPKRDVPSAPSRPVVEEPPSSTQDTPSVSIPDEEQEEQARKRRLADRMAKLGGIKFGAPPLPHYPPIAAPEEHVQEVQPNPTGPDESSVENEEDEQARRQRIAAKLAGMGGMRFGMLPLGIPGGPPPPVPNARPSAQKQHPALEVDSISEDEGVKVEAEESEMEEVSYEDAEDEVPPPVPSREVKPAVSPTESVRKHLPPPGVRPPVPTSTSFARKPSIREPSTDSNISHQALQRHVSSQSDYVMVEEPGSEVPPPILPSRPTRAPHPPRYVPPPVPVDASESLGFSQWELPSIPSASLDLSGTGDLSLSTWSEESTVYPSNAAKSPSPPIARKARPISQDDVVLSVDQLSSIWGRVGVQICEIAAELHDKSKKTLIGDGTYVGFLNAVMSRMPNAFPFDPNASSFGYLIYAQTGASVQKRLADIMPGDIILLQDAKLKGHKGLQTYHQNAGDGQPLVGIIGDFDQKKSKVRVYQANQHVGHQTVESVSYRLDDMRSGTIKVFRALES